jgi:hypothetical protein
MRKRGVCSAFWGLLAVAGCSDAAGPDLFDLARNQAKWSSNGPDVYQFDFHRSCFCPDESLHRVRIVVDDGVVQSAYDLDTQQPVATDQVERFYRITVDSLFGVVWDARERADEIRVEFDAALGYPRHIQIDYITNGVDDELSLRAEHLTPVN